jgi:lysozyme
MTNRIKNGTKAAVVLVVLVAGFEGLRTIAYRDPVGIPTICFGETRNVHMGDVKSKEECKTMLANRLGEFERGINECLRNPGLIPDGAYVASISFAYNVGVRAFCNSTMKKKLDAGDIRGACDELLKWTKARGIYLPGLANRRKAEREICLKAIL